MVHPRPVRIGIRCADERDFQERFAPRYAAEGVFVPGEPIAPEGTMLRVTIELKDGRPVLSGTARLEAWTEAPAGMWLRIVRVNSGSVPIAPVLMPAGPPAASQPPAAAPERDDLGELLFADLPPPEEFAASKPIQVRSSSVKLRLQSTRQPGEPPAGESQS